MRSSCNPPDNAAPPAPTATIRSSVARMRPLLGTFVEIRVTGLRAAAAEAAIVRAFRAIEQVQARMSPHDPASDVARINATRRGGTVVVHPWTWRVLTAAQALSRATDGEFDVTLRGGGAPRSHGDWRSLELRPGRRVGLRQRVTIDLGGIAKGFAVDRAVDVLRRSRATGIVVNAGGDLRVCGIEAVPVVVRHPAVPHMLLPLATLRQGAVATSANYLDPKGRGRLQRRAGRAWIGRGSVSVQARTALAADALTKLVAAIGPLRARPILRRYGATALALQCDGRVILSEEVAHAA
jgi:thiamine biosynthesis lipoprotein